jgi:hypothetical protein
MHSQVGFSAIVIKAIDEERREITGIASTPQLDRVNDVVEPLGLTFAKDTPLLLNHNHEHPVGNVQFGTPTAKGLPFKATIAKVMESAQLRTVQTSLGIALRLALSAVSVLAFVPWRLSL